VAALTFTWGAGEAVATHVSCGDTITTDTTLDSDLANCPGPGLVIGADNVTLDLGGHTIDGDGGTGFDVGIVNGPASTVDRAPHSGVTIENGTV
jgi:hypothetical protein